MLFTTKMLSTVLLLLPTLTFSHDKVPDMGIVMRGGDTIWADMDAHEMPTFRDGKCKVRFQNDGNWGTQDGILSGGFNANTNSHCRAESDRKRRFKFRLQRDGNFVAYHGDCLDYATHSDGDLGDYYLGIDDDCILHIMDEKSDREVWTNIRTEPLKNGDRLGKGEMVRVGGNQLVMQNDGNLVLYEGIGKMDMVLWDAAHYAYWTKPWEKPSDDMFDFFARVADNGHLTITAISSYHPLKQHRILDYELKGFDGESCFTMEYDHGTMAAKPCRKRLRA